MIFDFDLMYLMKTIIFASSIGLMQIKICPAIKTLPRALGKLIMREDNFKSVLCE